MKSIDKKIEGAKAHLNALIRKKYPRIDEPYSEKDIDIARHVFKIKRDMSEDEIQAVYEMLSVFMQKPATAIQNKIGRPLSNDGYIIDRKTQEQEKEEKRIKEGGQWVPFDYG
jgi:hypothetical protein